MLRRWYVLGHHPNWHITPMYSIARDCTRRERPAKYTYSHTRCTKRTRQLCGWCCWRTSRLGHVLAEQEGTFKTLIYNQSCLSRRHLQLVPGDLQSTMTTAAALDQPLGTPAPANGASSAGPASLLSSPSGQTCGTCQTLIPKYELGITLRYLTNETSTVNKCCKCRGTDSIIESAIDGIREVLETTNFMVMGEMDTLGRLRFDGKIYYEDHSIPDFI